MNTTRGATTLNSTNASVDCTKTMKTLTNIIIGTVREA